MRTEIRNKKCIFIILSVSLVCNIAFAETNSTSNVLVEELDSQRSDPSIEETTKETTINDDQKCVTELESSEWIDKMRNKTHHRVCRSVLWVDSLFGDEHEFNDENFTGKISIGFRQDEQDGLDPKLRVRIKTRLPNVSDRLNAFIGRVEEDSYISNTEVDEGSFSQVGLRSTDEQEDEWLVGLGYRNPDKDSNGFDYSVGAKISSGIQGYARLAHRRLFQPTKRSTWRTTQTVFWHRDDRFGVSSRLDLDHIVNDTNILEWDTTIKYTQANERIEWLTSGVWHHSITSKKGISSRAYVRGETERPTDIPEFGTTFTYVTPFLRPWFFIETGIDFRWEKEFPQREYQSKVRFLLQFQMLLGDYYARRN